MVASLLILPQVTQETPHEHQGAEQADDKTDGEHDHRHPQSEANDHQEESESHGRQVGENPFAGLQQPSPATRWLRCHGARTGDSVLVLSLAGEIPRSMTAGEILQGEIRERRQWR